MNISIGTKEIKQRITKQVLTSITDVSFGNGYSIYVFPGSLSENDILIKYSDNKQRLRTPKHIHWSVDILIKKSHDEYLTNELIGELIDFWNRNISLHARNYDTVSKEINNIYNSFNYIKYKELNSFGEYPVDFLYLMICLLAIQEKTNNKDAFMFKSVIDELYKPKLDIFKVVSTSTHNGR